jgi:replicative DNA helicase
MLEQKLLSKVIDEKNFYELYRYGVELQDFETNGEVYVFIKDYVKQYGQTPDRRTVVEKYDDFEYEADVSDSMKYLATQLKGRTAKRMSFELLQHQAGENFKKMDGDKFVDWLAKETNRIKDTTASKYELGTNFAVNGEERLQWYEDAKDPSKQVFIPTPYPSLTKYLGGGFEISDYILLMAFTNVGKSWIGSQIGLTAWQNNFGVLYYSPELSKRQQMFRLDTINGQFNNMDIRRGQLQNEEQFKEYLKDFNGEKQETKFIIKTMEDLPDGLTIETIEHDLHMHPDVSMVVIDGFNLMVHGNGKSNDRNAMTTTSRKLRQIFGRHQVAGVVIHQTNANSEKERKKAEEDSEGLLRAPDLMSFSETIAVVQDSATALTFNAQNGVGILKIAKCREPNKDKEIELITDFNQGIIKEQSDIDYF